MISFLPFQAFAFEEMLKEKEICSLLVFAIGGRAINITTVILFPEKEQIPSRTRCSK
jgi:hypothetical protein